MSQVVGIHRDKQFSHNQNCCEVATGLFLQAPYIPTKPPLLPRVVDIRSPAAPLRGLTAHNRTRHTGNTNDVCRVTDFYVAGLALRFLFSFSLQKTNIELHVSSAGREELRICYCLLTTNKKSNKWKSQSCLLLSSVRRGAKGQAAASIEVGSAHPAVGSVCLDSLQWAGAQYWFP